MGAKNNSGSPVSKIFDSGQGGLDAAIISDYSVISIQGYVKISPHQHPFAGNIYIPDCQLIHAFSLSVFKNKHQVFKAGTLMFPAWLSFIGKTLSPVLIAGKQF
ncbi:hypothetical protein ES703_57940 [subsurface metagenome]